MIDITHKSSDLFLKTVQSSEIRQRRISPKSTNIGQEEIRGFCSCKVAAAVVYVANHKVAMSPSPVQGLSDLNSANNLMRKMLLTYGMVPYIYWKF